MAGPRTRRGVDSGLPWDDTDFACPCRYGATNRGADRRSLRGFKSGRRACRCGTFPSRRPISEVAAHEGHRGRERTAIDSELDNVEVKRQTAEHFVDVHIPQNLERSSTQRGESCQKSSWK